MAERSSLYYLPPNLTTDATPVFPNVANVLDEALELTYYSEINKLKNIYNPASEYYDTSYILDLLGENTLKNLLSDITDAVSLTMIVSNIQNIKGTKAAFEAILKLIKLDYRQIIYTKLPNGCTEVTIIMDSSVRVSLSTISDLIKFSQEVFPLCLSLSGITNCTVYDSSMSYSGYNELDFGIHVLDRTFVLDMSKLDTTYGKTVTTGSGSLNVLICNPTYMDSNLGSGIKSDGVVTNNTTSNFLYSLSPFQRLDYNIVLDRQNENIFYGSSTYISTVKNLDMLYTGYDTELFQTRTNITQFRLDRDPLDRFFYKRLDGVIAQKINHGLDNGIVLDKTKIGTVPNSTIVNFTNLSVGSTNVDAKIRAVTGSTSYTIKSWFDTKIPSYSSICDVGRAKYLSPMYLANTNTGKVNTITVKSSVIKQSYIAKTTLYGYTGASPRLDYSKNYDSQYIPALTI